MPTSDVKFSLNDLFWEFQVIEGPSLDEVKLVTQESSLKTKLTVIDGRNRIKKLDAIFTRVEKRGRDDQDHYAVFMKMGNRPNRFMMYDPVQQHGAVRLDEEFA